jgi:putative oxidoreductase
MPSISSRTRLAFSGGRANAGLWVLRGLLAAVFLMSGVPKWLGDDATTATFAELGAGQWLRYVIGTVEIAGAIGLLIPSFVGLAALALLGVMAGAALSEATVLEDGNPVAPTILFALAAIVAWYRRETILPVLRRLDIRSARSGRSAR